MATLTTTLKFSLILLSFLHAQCATATPTSAASAADIKFVREACQAAPFPTLCTKSLKSKAGSIDRDEKNLTTVALELALNRTLSAQLYIIRFGKENVLKSADIEVLQSCTKMVGSGVSQLHRSLMEMENLGTSVRGSKQFAMTASYMHYGSNMALAETQSCKDLMSDHQNLHTDLRVSIKARMEYASQVIANSMALSNTFVYGHN